MDILKMYQFRFKEHLIWLVLALTLVACDRDHFKQAPASLSPDDERKQNFGKVFGEEFLLFGESTRKASDQTVMAQASVNSYLWQASLEALSFLPLQSTDSVGGVIVSDWYTSSKNPHERLKITVRILSKELRSESLKVVINKQTRNGVGSWVDAGVDPTVKLKLETIILSKARDLRLTPKDSPSGAT